jgi:hypothetical protein
LVQRFRAFEIPRGFHELQRQHLGEIRRGKVKRLAAQADREVSQGGNFSLVWRRARFVVLNTCVGKALVSFQLEEGAMKIHSPIVMGLRSLCATVCCLLVLLSSSPLRAQHTQLNTTGNAFYELCKPQSTFYMGCVYYVIGLYGWLEFRKRGLGRVRPTETVLHA